MALIPRFGSRQALLGINFSGPRASQQILSIGAGWQRQHPVAIPTLMARLWLAGFSRYRMGTTADDAH
jgi:hypothetical protein